MITQRVLALQVHFVVFVSVHCILVPDCQFEYHSFLHELLNSQHAFVPGDQKTVPGTSEKNIL